MAVEMERNARGRFTGVDFGPELRKKWADDEKRAKAAEKVCQRFGLQMDWLGIRKLITGVWNFSDQSETALWFLLYGLVRGGKLADNERPQAILEITDALGYTDEFIAGAKERLGEGQRNA